MNLWQMQQAPIYALAPMADVTDPAYRSLIAEYATVPFITWTEFVSADGLYHTREKKGMQDSENPLVRDLQYSEGERPIIAQLFTSKPEMMEYAANLAYRLGYDGVDINMGCPDKSIEKQGAGAAHIKDPENAKKVIEAAIRGVEGKIPVSVKTRIGYNKIEYKEWLPHLLATDIAALTIHLRTRKEMSKVDAHWELAGEIVAFCRELNPRIKLLANGDIKDLSDARAKIAQSGLDGAMLGRAVFGNPWLFTERSREDIAPKEKLAALLELSRRFDALTPAKHFAILKKHVKAFVVGWDGAAELRTRLMETQNLSEMEEVLAGLV